MQHTDTRKRAKLPESPSAPVEHEDSPNLTASARSLTFHWTVLTPIAFMSLCVLLVMIARVRLLSVPLERDEGEYAFIGQLMLEGVPPYAEAANMKLPGTDAAYALIMAIFGQSIVGIHLGFLIVNAASILLVFFLARKLFGVAPGVAAAASYAVLSVQPNVLGLWAHATHFVVLPALGGTLLLLKWNEQRKGYLLAASGLLFGTAFLAKQAGVLFIVFGLLYLIYTECIDWRKHVATALRDVALFGASVALPFGVMCLLLWRARAFARFWYWTFTYARYYVSMMPLSEAFGTLKATAMQIASEVSSILVLALAGLAVLWGAQRSRTSAMFLTGFLVCSFAAVCPGLYFRPHYFILMLPAIALLAGAFATTAKKIWPLWVIAAAVAYPIWREHRFLFELSPLEATRVAYGFGLNPFPEAIEIADYIRAHSNRDDRVAILGSEPEIFFYSHRRSVTPYLYVYPLIEKQPLAPQMQDEFIRDVEAGQPRYIVIVNEDASYLKQLGQKLLEWAVPQYQPPYELVGVINMRDTGSAYEWDATRYHIQAKYFITVLRRKGT